MQIEKLKRYKTSDDWYHWYERPTSDDIINKINEIIDCINSTESDYLESLKDVIG